MFSSRILGKTFLFWLPFAVTVTILCGVVYVTVQYSLRSAANDPQIQMSKDFADAIQSDQTINMGAQVDMGKSLAPYIILFDNNGKITTSSASFNNKLPKIPGGLLATARKRGELRFTWQLEPEVRQAAVMEYVNRKGYILVGRSLKEVEIREIQVIDMVFIAWLIGLGSTLFFCFLYQALYRKR